MIPPEIRRPLLVDGSLSRLMDVLTGGAFLAGLGVWAGADNWDLALLAALPFLAQVLQLPTVALLLRWKDRRKITVRTAGLARVLLLLLAGFLLLSPSSMSAERILLVLAASAALAVVATASWNWWMRDLLPERELGRFFGSRLRGATLVAMGAMLAAGAGLDWFVRRGDESLGYVVLFGVGGFAGLLGVLALARTPHIDPPPSPPARHSTLLIAQAFREAPLNLVGATSLAAMAVSFSLPLVAVFLLRSLGFSFLAASAMAVVSQIAYLIGIGAWSHISDNHGDRAVLATALALISACLLGWTFAGFAYSVTTLVWVGVLHFLAGFALGGIELANSNLLLRSAPQHNVAAHMAALSFMRAVVAGTGLLAAGVIWQAIGRGPLLSYEIPGLGLWDLRAFQILCAMALIPAIAALVFTKRMPAPAGGGRVRDVARIMRREVHQMSSIAGLRGIIHAVSYTVEAMAFPFAARDYLRASKRQRRGAPEAVPVGQGAGPQFDSGAIGATVPLGQMREISLAQTARGLLARPRKRIRRRLRKTANVTLLTSLVFSPRVAGQYRC